MENASNNVVQTVQNFVAGINAHDVAAIDALMATEFRFVDAMGAFHPITEMRGGWEKYFSMFPDYRIEVEDIFAHENTVALFGWASGSFQGSGYAGGKDWRFPSA